MQVRVAEEDSCQTRVRVLVLQGTLRRDLIVVSGEDKEEGSREEEGGAQEEGSFEEGRCEGNLSAGRCFQDSPS